MTKKTDSPRYRWDDEKNRWLKKERGFGFEDVVLSLEEFGPIDDIAHPNPQYAHQRILFVVIEGYAIAVPYVTDEEGIFLKTAYASRKTRKHYLLSPDHDH